MTLLREAGTDSRLVAFNAFISGLARSNLRILAERGVGAKLSRGEVAAVAAEVARELGPACSARSGSRTPTDAPRSRVTPALFPSVTFLLERSTVEAVMRVSLTGATGFIGSHVARALIARGESVSCLCRPTSHRVDLQELTIDWVMGDLADKSSLRRAMASAEVLFHCAADYRLYARDPAELYRHNVDGTRNVLEIAAESGVRQIVYTSSVGTLALHHRGRRTRTRARCSTTWSATTSAASTSPSAWSTSWMERGLPIVVVSPSTPIGERDAKPTPTGRIVVDFLSGRLPAYVDTGLNLVDVRDVALGHLLAAERGRPGENYILGDVNLTLQELLELLGRLTGGAAAAQAAALGAAGHRPPRGAALPLAGPRSARAARRRADVESLMFFDSSKAVRELGFPQSPLEPALERAVGWFVDHDYAPAQAARLSS